MRAVFNVWPEVRIRVNVDDKTLHVQATRAEEAPDAARNVFSILKKYIAMRSLKVSFHDKGKEGKREVLCTKGKMRKDMKKFLSEKKAWD